MYEHPIDGGTQDCVVFRLESVSPSFAETKGINKSTTSKKGIKWYIVQPALFFDITSNCTEDL